ncbi:hypothetical protein [Thermoactinomyces sp. DSM 45892]|uniref:hypothetical protein n=1 Tax=Thermoactinomyces sp. DSM 45892 TaxID=1882753 RepID=UPI00089C98AF|nr:hypothetical protein [Thermoactinomyces sp. DSM 45892]SDY21942.1 hypothetical protein SAMN05444416_1039 [Thermoactinomyces sp. DSM 45892]
MKKTLSLLLIFNIILITATSCETSQSAQEAMKRTPSIQPVVSSMNEMIQQENQNDTLLQKMAASVEEAKLKTISNQKVTDLEQNMIPKVNQAKSQIAEYKKAVESVQERFKEVKQQVNKLTNPSIQQPAQRFLTDFETSIQTELSIATKYEELLQNQSEAIQAIIKSKPLPTDNSDQLVTEIDQLVSLFQEQVKKLNASYQKVLSV